MIFSTGDNNNVTGFAQDSGGTIYDDNNIALNTNVTAAFVNNGTNTTGYVNGTPDSDVGAAALDAGNADVAIIGSFTGFQDYFDGVISDVRTYNRALTANEVAELNRMDSTSTVNTSGFLTSSP